MSQRESTNECKPELRLILHYFFFNLLSGLSIVIRRRTIINIIPVSTLSNLLVHSSAVKPGGGWPRLEKVFFKHTFFGF